MRILLLTQFFQPEPMFKGLPLARALMARGHHVEVLTGYPNYPGGRLYPGFERQTVRREVMDGVVVNRVPLYPSHDRSGARRAANYLSFGATAALVGPHVVEKIDVIWAYNLVTLAPAWSLIRALHRAPVVLDVQDLWPESILNSGMLRRAEVLGDGLRAGCALAYRNADRLVAQSPGFKRHLAGLGVSDHKIDVIYNWTDELAGEISDAERVAARRRLGFEGRFNVLFAGAIGHMQALDCMVDAAALLAPDRPEVLFTFLGAGIDVDRLKARASGLKNVQFLPRCSVREAAVAAQAADALLVHLKNDPLFSITIPSKTQSYLRSGKPILIGIRGDAAHLVEEAQAGFCFEPENAPSLAATVKEMMALPREKLDEMGNRGKAFYRDHLSFRKGVGLLEESFHKAIRGADVGSEPGCETLV